MKILFDLIATQPLKGIKNHGGAEYTKVVFYKLVKEKKDDVKFSAVYSNKELLDDDIKNYCSQNNVELLVASNAFEIEKVLNDGKYDKFFSGLGYSHRKLKIPCETIFLPVVHGLRPIEMPTDEYEIYFLKTIKEKIRWLIKTIFKKKYLAYRIKDYKKFLLKYQENLVVVSNHTKKSILSFFPEMGHASIKVFYSPEKITPKIDLTTVERKKYFLMISSSVWLKNSYRGVIALDKLFNKKEYKEYNAIILGGLPKAIKKKIINMDNFKFKGYVSAQELEKLYAEAYALFYPTLNEGFGYPPLEAMKYGTPVVVSDITSLPEVCGNAAIYFNPFSIEEMTARLEGISTKNYSELKEKSLAQYQLIKEKQNRDLDSLVKWILQ